MSVAVKEKKRLSLLCISFFCIGQVKQIDKKYEEAIEIYQKTLPSNHPHLAISYNKMRDYSKVLSYYECALNI